MMERDVRILQTCYPTIYLACHSRHERRRTASGAISAADSSLLAHHLSLTSKGAAAMRQHSARDMNGGRGRA
ncbi:MAG TPA: hypothetical protein VNR64_00125 [Vicinamibacterales bacterium]|nr:hypothetical protein [Vicinamibacterales bacterium]